MEMSAILDRLGTYRYALYRQWDSSTARIAFIMLNPSTADGITNDPTIRRCICFAQAWGYGSLAVVNLFALRATHPQELRQSADPIGGECDRHILKAASSADCTVIAWGNWGKLQGRDQAVLKLLNGVTPVHCLGINQSGQPRHPLYLKSSTPLVRFNPESNPIQPILVNSTGRATRG
ncbi:MAG: DUF1643 domain-containing protein [Leptolyngbyaceae cyanobacterium CRU_2_3]|nr:DUF1643 domain-containing protein [Leptolyngbyaceae cyanobacterium CRU_2_3]